MWPFSTPVFALALIFAAASPVSCAKQAFDVQPRYQEVNPGEDVVLECRVSDKSRNSECIWQKDGKPVRLQDGKYEWNGRLEGGDCSLKVLKADIMFDDGGWRCQVTSSSYTADDALSSKVAKLVVRIPPTDPRLFFDGGIIDSQVNIRACDWTHRYAE